MTSSSNNPSFSTHHAPWVIVEANDKLYARVKVLRTVEQALREGLGRGGDGRGDGARRRATCR